jgi:hypothetical protein
MTEETSAKPQKESIRTSKILEQERRSDKSPTIIINNNYNVSLNLYDPTKPIDPIEIIPPINFSRQDPFQGYMTDRLNDNHTHHKYYLPYTTKTDKKDNDRTNPYPNDNPDSIRPENAHFAHEKNFLNFSSKLDPNYYAPPLQRDPRITHNPNSKLEIPRIRLEGIDYNIEQEEEAKEKLTGRDLFERHRLDQEKRDVVVGDKSKLSLAELRKMQKKEQEKCVMKVSKVISIKEKWENSQEEEKQQPDANSYHSTNTQKDRSSQQLANFPTPNPQKTLPVPKDMKSLKTSLMTKRKPGMERKNSETM